MVEISRLGGRDGDILCRVKRVKAVKPFEAWNAFSELLGEATPSGVGIDAPLNVLEPSRPWRECEKEALAGGARLLPLSMKSMRRLSQVGYSLQSMLMEAGIPAVEAHPASILRPLGLKTKSHVLDAVIAGLGAGLFFEGVPSVGASVSDCVLVYSINLAWGRKCLENFVNRVSRAADL